MDKDFYKVTGAIALNTALGHKPLIARGISDQLGSLAGIHSLPPGELGGIITSKVLDDAARIHETLSRDGVHFLTIEDDAYPDSLRSCPDAPVLLYWRGCSPPSEVFRSAPAVSIIGTRKLGSYGRDWCRRIVHSLSQCPEKPSIVSGLAMGTDICAHRAALEDGLPTIAVSPVGIDTIYPRSHERDAGRIISTPGCAVVTDYPPGTLARPEVFLRRNRIIAGLSRASILIESRVRGGGMSTCRLAFGYGRDVYVLPGRADDINSGGCNQLIAEKIAEPILDTGSLPQQLGLEKKTGRRTEGFGKTVRRHFSSILSGDELTTITRLALTVREHRGISYDELCARSGLDFGEVARLAGMLELEGFIETDIFQRCTINSKIV